MDKRLVFYFITIFLCGSLLLGGVKVVFSRGELQPRKPQTSPELALEQNRKHRLTMKFRDHLKVRAENNGSAASKTGMAMSAIGSLRAKYKLRFRPLIELSEERLSKLEKRAENRSRRVQPDLGGIMIVEVPGASDELLMQVGRELQGLDVVEYVYLERLRHPPPGDISPTTPNLTSQQTYFAPDPGIDVDYAWSLGYRGDGVRLSDCEYGWVYTHEDLMDKNLHPEPGQTPHPEVSTNDWDEHGTAVMGEICGVINAYGVSGMVPDTDIYTYPEWTVESGDRRVTSITNAIADSAAGDIVLLEMQGDNLAPAEVDPSVHAAVKTGVDAGIIVVSAAGNGGKNLDGPDYTTYRSWGDSGAIMVGGGTPDVNHDQNVNSCYGSRVNVQGWWGNVFTLGYGDYAEYGGDKNQRYISNFDGTSGASPFVASACVAIQDKAQDYGRRLSPLEMRYLLIETGIPQGSGGHVGPFPDLRAAMALADELARGVWVNFGYSGTENGSFEKPHNTLAEGVAAAPTGGYVHVKAGSSSEIITITKAVNIMSWGGPVVVGR